jgi:hypothetical protein
VLAKTSSTDYDTNWTTLGTLATQNANAVAVTGGTIDDTAIGSTTPDAGTFTQVAVTTGAGSSAFNNNDTITGWNYSGKSFSITAQETSPTGLFIGSSGTKVYVNGTTGDDVNEYTLSTAWDITTASFVGVFSTAAQDTAPTDLFFAPDGLTMYVVGDTNNIVFQYTLSTAWSIATASYASKSFSVSTQESTPSGLWFKPDGTQMYVVGSTTDAVYQYTLSTAWDVSTASYSGIFYSVAQQETSPQQINLNADGTKMWVAGNVGDDIWEYSLSSAWNVSTATPINNFYIGFQDTAPTGLFIDSTAANRVYMVGSTTDFIYQYNTATNSLKLDTAKLYVDGVLSVNDNLVAGQNAYVDNTLTVQGATTLSSLTITGSINANNNTSSLALGTAQTTGTWAAGSTTQTGTMTFGQSTASQTTNIQAGATASGSTKTLNIGTAGLSGSTTNISIGSAVSGSLGTATISAPTVNIGQTGTQLSVTNTASAVNYVQVTGAAVSGQPTILATGSDAAVGLTLNTKGVAPTRIQANGISIARFTGVASAVNFLDLAHAVSGQGPVISAQSISDTNVPLVLRTTGTGAIDLAAGSSGVNISNGNTVTSISRTASGINYTSIPTVTVSAPTTAGGTTAIATASMTFYGSSPTVNNGGTGYTVNDILTVAGTTPASVLTLTVTAVSGGVITAATHRDFGNVTTLPAVPYSVTGGTGTGATFTSNWQVNAITVTNAGSGYVEQPTVTFSGGGGSGAAAYAFIGNAPTIKALGGAQLNFATSGGTNFAVSDSSQNQPATYAYVTGGSSSAGFGVISSSGNAGLTFTSKGTSAVDFYTNNYGSLGLKVSHTASAVNYVQVTGAATAGIPAFSAQGSDANISLALTSKGTGSVRITNAGSISNPALSFSNINRGFYDPATGEIGVVGAGWEQFRFGNTPTTVNYGKASGAAAGAAPVFSVAGTDTNIALAIQSKGTGAIDLAAGSSGVNISNGNTVTAITRTAVGFGYTSIPTVTVSVPTTAGGVQATASASQMFASSANVAGGGTGYAVNDVLTVAGGTPTIATQLTVTSVSAGVITAVSIVGNTGGYTVLPSNPVSVTGGTGTGATFTINYGVTSVAITNAGSGYVEQPTVTFSGGGGSGAAAYASVGAGSIIRALGSTGTQSLDFSTPASSTSAIPALRLRDPTVAADSYPMFWNGAGYTTMYAQGNANASLFIGANGTGAIRFQTNGTSGFEQMRVVHTASAVNYVQVTGAGTGAQPLVSTQGTDANISMSFTSKGTGSLNFWTNNSGTRQFSISNTDSAVNFVQVTGAATGARPVISAQGSDTNIGLTFTAKGTGIHAFNNGTGTQLVLQTGPTSSVNRIEITPSITNSAPIIASGGTDTNIDLALTPKGTGSVVVNSPIRIDTHLVIDAVTATTSTTTADQVLATFDATLYRTIKLTVQAADGTNYQSTELLAVHNGTTVNHTEYGTVTVGTACASYTVDYLVGTPSTVRLLATPASATATTYRIAAYLTRV